LALLEVRGVWKTYNDQTLLRGVSFNVEAGETVSLLGPSGSGKSTLLRIIAGLEQPEEGQVRWDGRDLAGVPVHQREFGLMFQDYALFPHRDVAENVAFGLRMHNLPRPEVENRTREALQRVNLAELANRRVTDLSGGEQQRVALARALAPRPRLLMLDEPLAALDRALREQLGEELRRILHEERVPAIYVTHDQGEAYTIADRLLLLNQGQLVQSGTPEEVYNHPATTWVARFLGLTNLIEGEVIHPKPVTVRTVLGVFQAACSHGEHAAGERVTLLLGPGGVRLVDGTASGGNRLRGSVKDMVFRGEDFRVNLDVGDGREMRFYLDRKLARGEKVALEIPPSEVLCLG
jgi:ABC-type Fe3+/spermidine/putrescine transport system ATPase subunit